nr:immunoglobulin heavy chain junction region [Mus musculus]
LLCKKGWFLVCL